MKWKFEKEFRADHPETIGETDKEFDLDNYKDWLEQKLAKLFAIQDVSQRSELLLKQMGDWLMKSTTLSVEAIVEFQEKFKQ